MTTDPRMLAVGTPDPRLMAVGLALSERYRLTGRIVMDDARAALAAADAVDPLRQPGHRVEIHQFSWTLQHPPECRPNLLDCALTRTLQRLGVSGIDDGTYAVELTEDGSPFFPDEATR